MADTVQPPTDAPSGEGVHIGGWDKPKPEEAARAPREPGYPFRELEPKWQAAWEKAGLFNAHEDDHRPKLYLLEMFPYPSGYLHAGHVRNYAIGDAVARYWRMRGYNVLHPM